MLSSPQAIKFIDKFGGVLRRVPSSPYSAMAIERERLHLQRQARLARLKERSIAS